MIDTIRAALGSDVPRETFDRLEQFAALLLAENQRQNLISRATEIDLWSRHFADAAQLIPFAKPGETWVDIGSGAGLPGLVIAILTGGAMTLVEPRRLRAEFLAATVDKLGLKQVTVLHSKAEAVGGKYDVITARAVASVGRLLEITAHLSHSGTHWVLPKGRSVQLELDEARKSWQGVFRLEPSRTDPEAQIVIATKVRRVSRARGMA